MRIFYLMIGFTSLGLALLGVVLPLLPTTPFLLLAIACFSRSSKRFEQWLYHTKLYQIYVADFRETGTITRERKRKITCFHLYSNGNFNLLCTNYLDQTFFGGTHSFYNLLFIQSYSR